MKYVIWLIVLVAIGGGGYYLFAREKSSTTTANTAPQTSPVERRLVEKVITANGKVASNRDVDIKCQASGKIIKLPIDISDRVKSGDLLMELDPIDQQHSLDQTKAQVNASKARLEQAKTSYDVAVLNVVTSRKRAQADLASAKARAADSKAKAARTEELFNSKLASKEDLETAQTSAAQSDASVLTSEAALSEIDQQEKSLDSKKQDIASAQASLDQDNIREQLQETQLEYTKVYVPEDEISKAADFRVSALTVQIGTIVQSGSSGFSGGTTVMTLSDVSHLYVLASVDESDIGQIADPAEGAERQKVRVTVDAYPGQPFDGEVVRVARKGVNTSNVVTFEVKIDVTSEDRKLLRPEMTATAKIIISSRPDVLAIPTAAFNWGSPPDTTKVADASATSDSTRPAVASGDDQTPTTRRGRGRGGRGGAGRTDRGSGGGVAKALSAGSPIDGYVQVLKPDNSTEPRLVTVGLSDDAYYEVLNGLDENDTVVLNKSGTESRFRGGQNPQQMIRGITGGRGGGGGRNR